MSFLRTLVFLLAFCATAAAQVSIPFPGPGGVGLAPVTVSFCTSGGSDPVVDPVTYTAQSTCTAAANRLNIVCVTGRRAGATTIDAVTLNAISGTQRVTSTNSDSGNTTQTACYSVVNPTGTTGDLIVDSSAIQGRVSYGIWALYGTGSAVPCGSCTITSTAAPATGSIDVVAGGALVCASYTQGATTNAWTSSSTTPNEDYDVQQDAAATRSGASQTYATTQTGITITDTYGSPSVPAMVCLSLGP